MVDRRLLLLQIRRHDDPILPQEVDSFVETIGCTREQITSHNLLSGKPTFELLDAHDAVLVGGSGDYSATDEGDWLEWSLDVLRDLYERKKPTFASCWGFQAMARALGGRVIHDPDHAELGTLPLTLTDAGSSDPLFRDLGSPFSAQLGHEDCVVELPPHAKLLASSQRVPNQAYTFDDRPIYATQFHPELSRERLLERIRAYPQYIEKITGQSYDTFVHSCDETPHCQALMRRFIEQLLPI